MNVAAGAQQYPVIDLERILGMQPQLIVNASPGELGAETLARAAALCHAAVITVTAPALLHPAPDTVRQWCLALRRTTDGECGECDRFSLR
jgi:hypothetical protein